MLLHILGASCAFLAGYLFFWATAIRLRKSTGHPDPIIDRKYLGFRSYTDMRSHVLGAQALWGPVIGVGTVALVSSLGWSQSVWIFAFLAGYGVAIWRFWRKPKRSWDERDLPT